MRERRQARRPGRPEPAVAPERIQKVLAAAGIGSRREVERWIAAGRLLVNGRVPEPGARLAAGDHITLDGRAVRVKSRDEAHAGQLLMMHRPPGTPLDRQEAARRASGSGRGVRRSGRWLGINPLPPVDGGLELLSDDGALVQRISRAVRALPMEFVLRVRGPVDEPLLAELRDAAEVEGEPMQILAADAQLGEGQNHWLALTVRATRSAQVRHWLAARGVIVSRLMRVSLGPLRLGRDLPRNQVRLLSPQERQVLLDAVDAALDARIAMPT